MRDPYEVNRKFERAEFNEIIALLIRWRRGVIVTYAGGQQVVKRRFL
jgi:hypothetical protein